MHTFFNSFSFQDVKVLIKEFEHSLSLPNTDRLQQIEDYVRGCTRQLAKVKTSYKFKEATMPWVPCGKVEFITSKVLLSPSCCLD
jgi:hypothetical protein